MSEYYDKYLALSQADKLRLIRLENNMSFTGADDILCPYCESPQWNIEEPDLSYDDGEDTQYTCVSFDCGKTFMLTTNISYSWDTQVPDDEAMAMLEQQLTKEKDKV